MCMSTLSLHQAKMARQDANEAKQAAQEALEEAQNANSLTQKTKSDLEDLNKKIRDFLIGANTSTPENVEKVILLNSWPF